MRGDSLDDSHDYMSRGSVLQTILPRQEIFWCSVLASSERARPGQQGQGQVEKLALGCCLGRR